MRYAIIFTISILILASCNKDKYTTAPQLKFKSANTKGLHRGEILTFTLSFTDAEGDLTDTMFIDQFEPRCVNSRLSRKYQLPAFPNSKNQSGDLLVTFGYEVNGTVPIRTPKCSRNDTCIFKFVLKDKAQNKSDTAYSDPVVIFFN